MAKRGSAQNTLFNYFSKSPSISSTRSPAARKQDEVSKEEPGESSKAKRVLDTESSEPEDEIKFTPKQKRRKVIIKSDSESDMENEEIKMETSENTENHSKTANNGNSSFIKKLQENSQNERDTPPIEEETIALDEPVVWPHNKLEFLKKENIKDDKGRRPDHPEYNPRTLYVPEKFLANLSPGVRQWWELKSKNFDCVIFFKVGKFYEFYHMDADIGVKELGFTYMRGEFAHSGSPEISYDKMAATLVDRGYKVARVEQTETPDMMAQRCKNQRSVTKFDRVVKREICQITNKGTQVFGVQAPVTSKHQPNYMLAVSEKVKNMESTYGICFIDTSIGDFFIGQFKDDKNCSRLLTLLSHNPPVLILYERGGASLSTQNILRSVLSNTIQEALINDSQFWTAEKTLKNLAEKYFSNAEGVAWPKIIKSMQDDGDHLGLTPNDEYKLGLRALGACIWYLTQCYLDQQVLAMARFNMYVPPDLLTDDSCTFETVKNKINGVAANRFMVLDSITLSNLRITGEEQSLESTLDNCCTKFGKRLLHHWICSPSCDINVIRERQDAITELLANNDVVQEVRGVLITLPDLERYMAQIHGFGNRSNQKNHPDSRAIMFEENTYNKRKIQNFIALLRGFKKLIDVPEKFSKFKSSLMVQLTQLQPKGIYPELKDVLNFFENSFNHEEALKDGVVAPEKGVDQEFDSIEEEIENIKEELQSYLVEQEKYFGCRINYFGNDKKRFQLEVPESNARKADSNYFLEGQKKGSKPVRRFHTSQTKEFLKRMIQVEDARNKVLKGLAGRIFEKFSNHYNIWKSCVNSIASLDVLISLAEFCKTQPVICVPDIVAENALPFIEIEEGYHPCLASSNNYIPNDITLGGSSESSLALLTGPNMGGKSTLMRQVGLLAIMAQIGAHVPARKFRTSLIDRIFTRLGAQDDILAGHSTFLVELNETASILKHSTVNSLVLLDELGRGTATYDGTAIAASVVNFLADVKCRTLFSTHYHSLVDYFQSDKRITLGHMACMVENEDDDDPTQETVIFLYKYSSGACPKSYGFNAAKLAGMPHPVIRRAYELSKKLEITAIKKKLYSEVISKASLFSIKKLIGKINCI